MRIYPPQINSNEFDDENCQNLTRLTAIYFNSGCSMPNRDRASASCIRKFKEATHIPISKYNNNKKWLKSFPINNDKLWLLLLLYKSNLNSKFRNAPKDTILHHHSRDIALQSCIVHIRQWPRIHTQHVNSNKKYILKKWLANFRFFKDCYLSLPEYISMLCNGIYVALICFSLIAWMAHKCTGHPHDMSSIEYIYIYNTTTITSACVCRKSMAVNSFYKCTNWTKREILFIINTM